MALLWTVGLLLNFGGGLIWLCLLASVGCVAAGVLGVLFSSEALAPSDIPVEGANQVECPRCGELIANRSLACRFCGVTIGSRG